MIAVHKEISFLHLCNSIPYLECTYPEIATVKDIKYNESPILSELIASYLIIILARLSHTIGIFLKLKVSSNWEIPEDKGMYKYYQEYL